MVDLQNKRVSPAAERNKHLIFEVLSPFLPQNAKILEIASGTGQHGVYFCEQRKDVDWFPSDPDVESLQSIDAYQHELASKRFHRAVKFDVTKDLPSEIAPPFDGIVNINMIHISPWESCLSLFQKAGNLLKRSGVLFLYGPFIREGVPTAESNLAFDVSLKERNSAWGIRQLERVLEVAEGCGFKMIRLLEMPANNLSVVFEKV